MKKINIATVFSGIGAIEHALQRLQIDHHIVFACDIDKYCKQTYFANYKINENQWYNDIKVLDGNKYKNKIDLFVGGEVLANLFQWLEKGKSLRMIEEICSLSLQD